jgi:SpoVK/Ycf46/Vps4 family AAA+-type ATPase
LGETEAAIRRTFEQARGLAPCVLFFDDFDYLPCKRSSSKSSSSSGVHARVLSTFLNELDGISVCNSDSMAANGSVLVLVAVVNQDKIDEALLRPGRLRHCLRLSPPSDKALSHIFAKRTVALTVAMSSETELDANLIEAISFKVVTELNLSNTFSAGDLEGALRRALIAQFNELNDIKNGLQVTSKSFVN